MTTSTTDRTTTTPGRTTAATGRPRAGTGRAVFRRLPDGSFEAGLPGPDTCGARLRSASVMELMVLTAEARHRPPAAVVAPPAATAHEAVRTAVPGTLVVVRTDPGRSAEDDAARLDRQLRDAVRGLPFEDDAARDGCSAVRWPDAPGAVRVGGRAGAVLWQLERHPGVTVLAAACPADGAWAAALLCVLAADLPRTVAVASLSAVAGTPVAARAALVRVAEVLVAGRAVDLLPASDPVDTREGRLLARRGDARPGSAGRRRRRTSTPRTRTARPIR